jgi:hypothetical protein
MINAINAYQYYGPFWLYVSTTQYNQAAMTWFTDGSGQTDLDRIRSIPTIAGVSQVDANVLADGAAVLVQMTPDVIDWAEALPLTVVEWMTGDGLLTNFKVMTIATPRLKARHTGKTGVVHCTGA